jgi:hypothetical protein
MMWRERPCFRLFSFWSEILSTPETSLYPRIRLIPIQFEFLPKPTFTPSNLLSKIDSGRRPFFENRFQEYRFNRSAFTSSIGKSDNSFAFNPALSNTNVFKCLQMQSAQLLENAELENAPGTVQSAYSSDPCSTTTFSLTISRCAAISRNFGSTRCTCSS